MVFRGFIFPAALTGVFCAGFAALIDEMTNMLEVGSVILLAFVSGFLGSLFARLVLRAGRQE